MTEAFKVHPQHQKKLRITVDCLQEVVALIQQERISGDTVVEFLNTAENMLHDIRRNIEKELDRR